MKKHIKIISIILLLTAATVGYFMVDNSKQNVDNNESTVNVDEDSSILPEIKQPDEENDKPGQADDTSSDQVTPEPKPNQETENNQNNTELSTPGITYAGPQSNGYVVEALVSTEKNGDCELLLSGPSTIKKTSPTSQQPSYRQCENFFFEKGELAKGEWTAKVRFKYNGEFSEYSDPYPPFTVQ